MFQRILVPVDLSEKSLAAVDIAYDFAAAKTAAEVVLLHVIETIKQTQFEFEELKPFYDLLESSARKRLQELSDRFVAKKFPIDRAIVYGQRTNEIIRFAIQNRTDLIIMASHRIAPEQPAHDWSSISYAVAILSPCTVLLVK